MKIEMLYPEVCNLFGDISNIKYLKKCLPDAEIIKTEINSEPAFVTQDIDMIYMGPMPENIQEVAIRKLRPYKEKIEELAKNKVDNTKVSDSGVIVKGIDNCLVKLHRK